MPYTVGTKASAVKALNALPHSLQRRVVAKIATLSDKPRPSGCVKLAGYENLWRIRVGDWRVVYSVDDEREHIVITIVAHRRESYRGL